jgi:hypothetical protein
MDGQSFPTKSWPLRVDGKKFRTLRTLLLRGPKGEPIRICQVPVKPEGSARVHGGTTESRLINRGRDRR